MFKVNFLYVTIMYDVLNVFTNSNRYLQEKLRLFYANLFLNY